MTHDERIALINRPFPVVHTVVHSKRWAGTLVRHEWVAEAGSRSLAHMPLDFYDSRDDTSDR